MAILRQLTFDLPDPEDSPPPLPDHSELIEAQVALLLAVFVAERGREVSDDERTA